MRYLTRRLLDFEQVIIGLEYDFTFTPRRSAFAVSLYRLDEVDPHQYRWVGVTLCAA